MDVFYEPHKLFLTKMIDAKVEFIMVGGYAVNFYGYNRPTGDMDLWMKPDNSNRDKFIQILIDEDFEDDDIEIIAKSDFSQPMIFHVGKNPYRIDFMNFIAHVNYEDADAVKIMAEIDGLTLPIIHYDHLLKSKRVSGRLKDQADVEELEKIRKRLNDLK